MTSKVYRSAQGKMVDLGTIILQNEHVRAVGNMKVNARGDKIDSLNQVIETRTERIQRHNDSTSTNVSSAPPQTSSRKTRANKTQVKPETQIQSRGHVAEVQPEPVIEITPAPVPQVETPPPVQQRQAPTPPSRPQPTPTQARAPEVDLKNPIKPAKSPAASNTSPATQGGGLAGAIARSREIKQELDRTRRQKAQDSGLRKI
jgi:outer membrane biosynthesis protein TonB